MFYAQKLPQNTKSNLKVQLSDFSKGINTSITQNLLPLNYATNCYNFDFNKRSLSNGLGIKEMQIKYSETSSKNFVVPDEVNKIVRFWSFTRYDATTNGYVPYIMFYCDDNIMYYGRLKTNVPTLQPLGVEFASAPNGITYRVDEGDSFFAFGENKIMMYSGRSLPTVFTENVPNITSIAMHAGRLYATSGGDQNVLLFSDDLNPVNWNVSQFEGGYIELTGERGVCKKLIEANNYLNVIREYGISRVSGWGLQDEFSVKDTYLTTGKLYHETAYLCGHIIIMLCADGLYYFDGGSMNKLNLGFESMLEGVDNKYAVGAFLDGKYYLACRLNYPDDEIIGCEAGNYRNNTLIELDLNDWNINIARGLDISYMYGIHSEYFNKLGILLNSGGDVSKLYELTHDGEVCGAGSHKFWTSPNTDMGYPNYKKVLKYLTINTKTDIKVTFIVDGKPFDFAIKGCEVAQRVPINLVGNKFAVSFSADCGLCEISDPVLQISLV